MPLRNVRGYALALTTARYYTPSGRLDPARLRRRPRSRTTWRPRDRKPCDERPGEAKLTDAGRKVYGGDGITPDYCVEPETPTKFVSYLIARQAFVGFARGLRRRREHGQRAEIAGTGSRSEVASAQGEDREPRLPGGRPGAGRLQGLPRHAQAALHAGGPRGEPRASSRRITGGGAAAGLRRGRGPAPQPGLGPAGARRPWSSSPRPSSSCSEPQRFIADRAAESSPLAHSPAAAAPARSSRAPAGACYPRRPREAQHVHAHRPVLQGHLQRHPRRGGGPDPRLHARGVGARDARQPAQPARGHRHHHRLRDEGEARAGRPERAGQEPRAAGRGGPEGGQREAGPARPAAPGRGARPRASGPSRPTRPPSSAPTTRAASSRSRRSASRARSASSAS